MVIAVLAELEAVDWYTSELRHEAYEYDGIDVVALQAARRLIFGGVPPTAIVDWALRLAERFTPVRVGIKRTAELSACAGLRAIAYTAARSQFRTPAEKDQRELLSNAASTLHVEAYASPVARIWSRAATGIIEVVFLERVRAESDTDDELERNTTDLAREAGELALHMLRAVYVAETHTPDGEVTRVASTRALADLRALSERRAAGPAGGEPAVRADERARLLALWQTHPLNTLDELVEMREREGDRCECGSSLAHVVADGLTAALCLDCDRDSSALDG